MFSLLSRYVNGLGENKSSSIQSDSGAEDTDERSLNQPPIINIEQATLFDEELTDEETSELQLGLEEHDSAWETSSDKETENTGTNTLPPLVLPRGDICRRIAELVEFYLSDENLSKDFFLLKHVSKNKEGYVSIKLLTSYKKVKRLTNDWRVVSHSLKSSATLELNSDGSKIRRRHSLSAELECDARLFRTIFASNIDPKNSSIDHLAEFFSKFGEMTSLQLYRPGGRVLEEVTQINDIHPGTAATVCAIVEYDKVNCARQALRKLSCNSDYQMKVMELPRKKRSPTTNQRFQQELTSLLNPSKKSDAESAYYSASASDVDDFPRQTSKYRPNRILIMAPSSLTSSPSVSPVMRRRYKAASSSPESSPPSSYASSRFSSPTSSPEEYPRRVFNFNRIKQRGIQLPQRQLTPYPSQPGSPAPWRHRGLSSGSESLPASTPTSPWLRRRVLTSMGGNSSSPSASPNLRRRLEGSQMVPENVTRFPLGPDGTKGFRNRLIISI